MNKIVPNYDCFKLGPFNKDFAHSVTIGNTLRRVLYSELSGLAITSVRFMTTDAHEFNTIDGIMESVLDFLFNLQEIRFSVTKDYQDVPSTYFQQDNSNIINNTEDQKFRNWTNPTLGYLRFKRGSYPGSRTKIYAKDLILPKGLKVVNPDAFIAERDDNPFNCIVLIEFGKGYQSIRPNQYYPSTFNGKNRFLTHQGFNTASPEELKSHKYDSISVDSLRLKHLYEYFKPSFNVSLIPNPYFSPIEKINYKIEEESLKRKDYPSFETIVFEIWTNGSITPLEALLLSFHKTRSLFNILNYSDLRIPVANAMGNNELAQSDGLVELYENPTFKQLIQKFFDKNDNLDQDHPVLNKSVLNQLNEDTLWLRIANDVFVKEGKIFPVTEDSEYKRVLKRLYQLKQGQSLDDNLNLENTIFQPPSFGIQRYIRGQFVSMPNLTRESLQNSVSIKFSTTDSSRLSANEQAVSSNLVSKNLSKTSIEKTKEKHADNSLPQIKDELYPLKSNLINWRPTIIGFLTNLPPLKILNEGRSNDLNRENLKLNDFMQADQFNQYIEFMHESIQYENLTFNQKTQWNLQFITELDKSFYYFKPNSKILGPMSLILLLSSFQFVFNYLSICNKYTPLTHTFSSFGKLVTSNKIKVFCEKRLLLTTGILGLVKEPLDIVVQNRQMILLVQLKHPDFYLSYLSIRVHTFFARFKSIQDQELQRMFRHIDYLILNKLFYGLKLSHNDNNDSKKDLIGWNPKQGILLNPIGTKITTLKEFLSTPSLNHSEKYLATLLEKYQQQRLKLSKKTDNPETMFTFTKILKIYKSKKIKCSQTKLIREKFNRLDIIGFENFNYEIGSKVPIANCFDTNTLELSYYFFLQIILQKNSQDKQNFYPTLISSFLSILSIIRKKYFVNQIVQTISKQLPTKPDFSIATENNVQIITKLNIKRAKRKNKHWTKGTLDKNSKSKRKQTHTSIRPLCNVNNFPYKTSLVSPKILDFLSLTKKYSLKLISGSTSTTVKIRGTSTRNKSINPVLVKHPGTSTYLIYELQLPKIYGSSLVTNKLPTQKWLQPKIINPKVLETTNKVKFSTYTYEQKFKMIDTKKKIIATNWKLFSLFPNQLAQSKLQVTKQIITDKVAKSPLSPNLSYYNGNQQYITQVTINSFKILQIRNKNIEFPSLNFGDSGSILINKQNSRIFEMAKLTSPQIFPAGAFIYKAGLKCYQKQILHPNFGRRLLPISMINLYFQYNSTLSQKIRPVLINSRVTTTNKLKLHALILNIQDSYLPKGGLIADRQDWTRVKNSRKQVQNFEHSKSKILKVINRWYSWKGKPNLKLQQMKKQNILHKRLQISNTKDIKVYSQFLSGKKQYSRNGTLSTKTLIDSKKSITTDTFYLQKKLKSFKLHLLKTTLRWRVKVLDNATSQFYLHRDNIHKSEKSLSCSRMKTHESIIVKTRRKSTIFNLNLVNK